MKGLLRLLRLDLALQRRSFLYPATVVSTATICGVLLLPPLRPPPPRVTAFLLFMDPATIGLSFVGAIVLMERAYGTLTALAVTPMMAAQYVGAKAISLTLLTLASTLVVAFVGARGTVDVARLLMAATLCSAVAVLVGLICVGRTASMNQLVVLLLWVTTLLYLPLLGFFGVAPRWASPVLAVIPSHAMLVSLRAAIDPGAVPALGQAAAAIYLAACAALGWTIAVRQFERTIVTEGH